MTRYVANNQVSSHKISFIVDGDFVSPDSASYSLYDNDGVIVEALQDVVITIGSEQTFAAITIPADANTRVLPTEIRFLEVTYVVDGATYTTTEFYIIKENIRLPVDKNDVRLLFGALQNELPDDMIDLISAFGLVKEDLPDIDLDAIISTGSELLPSLISAIKYRAAMTLSISVQNSMMQSEQADNNSYKRFDNKNFADFFDNFSAEYRRALAILLGDAVPVIGAPVFSLMVTGVDPVTGA